MDSIESHEWEDCEQARRGRASERIGSEHEARAMGDGKGKNRKGKAC